MNQIKNIPGVPLKAMAHRGCFVLFVEEKKPYSPWASMAWAIFLKEAMSLPAIRS